MQKSIFLLEKLRFYLLLTKNKEKNNKLSRLDGRRF